MNNLDLKDIRKKLRYTQSEMAEKLDITASTYQKYEYGERNIPQKVQEIAQELKNGLNNSHTKHTRNSIVLIGDAIELILNNIEEAEKNPLFSMYKHTLIQEGKRIADKEHMERLLKLQNQ